METLSISKQFEEEIIKKAISCLEKSNLVVIHYTEFETDTKNHAAFATKEKIEINEVGSFVYALYKIKDDESSDVIPLYVGSSTNPSERLKKHLLKNDDALVNGNYIKDESKIAYRSKISNVYKMLVYEKPENRRIGYKIFKVENAHLYSTIESLLIEHYKLKEHGWNIQE